MEPYVSQSASSSPISSWAVALPAPLILQSVARAAGNVEITHRHEHAAYADVGAQPLAYPRALPEDAHHAVLVAVHDAGEEVVHVGRRADQEEDDQEEGLEVEEGGLAGELACLTCRGWEEA